MVEAFGLGHGLTIKPAKIVKRCRFAKDSTGKVAHHVYLSLQRPAGQVRINGKQVVARAHLVETSFEAC